MFPVPMPRREARIATGLGGRQEAGWMDAGRMKQCGRSGLVPGTETLLTASDRRTDGGTERGTG